MEDRRNWEKRPFVKDVVSRKGMAKKKGKRELTAKELADAALLKAQWNRAKELKDIQARAFANSQSVNETNISQYINGNIPLNVEWKMRFAQYLDVVPQDIWPDWEFSGLTPGALHPSAVKAAKAWYALDPKDRPAVDAVLDRLQKKSA